MLMRITRLLSTNSPQREGKIPETGGEFNLRAATPTDLKAQLSSQPLLRQNLNSTKFPVEAPVLLLSRVPFSAFVSIFVH